MRSDYGFTGSLEIMASQEQRKVKVGMVGGGPGAGIAETHRTAMRLDDRYELVAGVFSRDREKSSAVSHPPGPSLFGLPNYGCG